ncbi:MAG: murein biosynthesis integral membrane protein MurJ, partial [Planctomycetota bacterium]
MKKIQNNLKMKKHLSSAKKIGLLTLSSRFLGLIRDMLCAALFGATLFWDSFILSWTIPNLFRRLFGEGALSSAFIPIFAKARKEKGLVRAFIYSRNCATYFSLLLLVLTALFYLVGGIFYFFSPQLTQKTTLFLQLSFILAPYLILICLTALASGALNSLDEFLLPAFLPVLLNLFWIFSLLLGMGIFSASSKKPLLLWMSGALILGGICQLLLSLVSLGKKGLSLSLSWDFQDPYLQETKNRMIPVIWSLALLQINVLLDRVIAEIFVPGNGAVSALYFGNRLVQFPLALVGISLATAVFPALSREALQSQGGQFYQTFLWALKTVFFIALPASIGLMILAHPIVEILFQRGSFQKEASLRTVEVLVAYGPSVCFYSMVHILNRAYYAKGNPKIPAKVASYLVGLNLLLNLVLVFPFHEAGLAISTSICSFLNCLILYIVFIKKYFSQKPKIIEIFHPKVILAASAMGA